MYKSAHKKRRIDENDSNSNDDLAESATGYDHHRTRQLLTEEFDLEIALRERLAATIESRVTWALILQETLENDVTAESTPGAFEDAALEAMDNIEAPCNIIFDRDPTPPDFLNEFLERSSRESVPIDTPASAKPKARKNRISRTRPQPHIPTKLLFIRNTTVSPPTVAKMVCPDCGRSDFTNLQGLLNHGRLMHKREYGSHDECMQMCAVVVEDDDEEEWVAKNGIELSGVSVPSLRRLFEIAVGEERNGIIDGFYGEEDEENAQVVSSTHLSKTLGHHKDTPALAPFLGRAPKRRCINVFDEDEEVNIDDAGPTSASGWRMALPHRNIARPELDVIAEIAHTTQSEQAPTGSFSQFADLSNNSLSTRFHVIARVVISDRSLWIPPERRIQALPDHTHSWTVKVDSPSYSLHISAFLVNLTVSCITDPPPSTITTPMSIMEPPFVISGTTDKPFLAKVTLTWAGPRNPPMEIEHWVELDPYHTTVHPVLGDEQVLDVELDRHTELLPIRQVIKPNVVTRDAGVASASGDKGRHVAHRNNDTGDPYYVVKLKSLLPQYPMTLKDIKGRISLQQIPYKLVSNPTQFRNLVPGRRKAIEWSRARALRDAYQAALPVSVGNGEDAISLTTADVFRWLQDEGLFPRPVLDTKNTSQAAKRSKLASTQPLPTAVLCSVCGMNHQQTKTESSVPLNGNTCVIVHDDANWHKMPMINIKHPLGLPLAPIHHQPPGTCLFTPGHTLAVPNSIISTGPTPNSRYLSSTHDIVAVANPDLTMGISKIIRPLALSHFGRMSIDSTTFPICELGGSKTQVETQLAPYALLASVTKTFISLLVQSGLDAASLDVSVIAARAKSEGRNTRKTRLTRDRLLTPSHIIRGLAGGSTQRGGALSATSLCLTRLGLGVSGDSDDGRMVAMGTRDRVFNDILPGEVDVKAEELNFN